MDYKTFPFEVKEIDAETGAFEGYASVFNIIDSYNEIVMPGAFTKTIAERFGRITINWQHDWRTPIGKPLELREDEHGLFVRAMISDTTQGRDARTLMKDGVVTELSFGYDIIKSDWIDRDGLEVQALLEVRLYEISPVTEAAMAQALITGVKSKAAIPYKKTPLADEGAEWSASTEVAAAEVDDLKIMCAIRLGDGDKKGDYKLPHHKAGGEHACVWAGVRAAASVLMGGRGGVNAPESDIKGAKSHIGKHYGDFTDKGPPPWDKSFDPAGLAEYQPLEQLAVAIALLDDTEEFKASQAGLALMKVVEDALQSLSAAAEPPDEALTAQDEERRRRLMQKYELLKLEVRRQEHGRQVS